MVDPDRDHLRRRRAEEPGVLVKHLFDEIRALGCTGSLNTSTSTKPGRCYFRIVRPLGTSRSVCGPMTGHGMDLGPDLSGTQ